MCGLRLSIRNGEILLYLGGGHEAVGLFVFLDVDDVVLAHLHAFLLFAEGAEEVFHQSPFQEGSVFVDPGHLQPGELADLGQWALGGGDEALVLVEIDEDLYFFPDGETIGHGRTPADEHGGSQAFRYVAVGQEDVACLFVAFQVEALLCLMVNDKGVVVAEFNHASPLLPPRGLH